MAQNAPGKAYRKGLTLAQIFRMFPDDAAAERWFADQRWPEGAHCPHCGSTNVQSGTKHKTMPYRCREKQCAKRFSVRTKTPMEASNLGFQVWVIALYQTTTNLKGVSSMKLHRDLGITQRSAWFLAHRLREAWKTHGPVFGGPVEVDETFIGGRDRNKHANKKPRVGRGPVSKAAVVGAKDRETNRVSATVTTDNLNAKTLHGFVRHHAVLGATVYTDDAAAYRGMRGVKHEAVRHGVGEYVRGMAHTNGIESFWSMLKRGYQGVYHKMSVKHLQRYVNEFAGRHNDREADTIHMMANVANSMDGKRLRYEDLIAPSSSPV